MLRRLAAAGGALALAALAATSGGGAASAATPAGGYSVYCSGSTATSFTGCYADGTSTPVSVPAGSTVTSDPVVPASATATNGLIAPDGILGVIPAAKVPASLGVPAGATTFLYIDKQVGYFLPGSTTSALTLPLSSPTSVTVSGNYGSFGAGTYYVANKQIDALSCGGSTYDAPSNTTTLTGCTSSASDSIPSGNSVGAPGACVTPGSVLQQIGEGSTKGKTLFKNNEDFAQVREAYTTDGTHFTDVTPSAGISGLANPTAQSGFRWVAPGGTVVSNPDGSLGLWYSEGQCTDGDSDAFGSIEYSTSTDGGLTWTPGVQVPDADTAAGSGYLSTDYTFGASIADQNTNKPLDVSAYFEGRIYSPSVVKNSDGGLTMTFSGYRTSKPLPATGSGVLPVGRACAASGGTLCPATTTTAAATQYTPQATEPALYRNILTVNLTQVPGSSPAQWTAGTPVVDQITNGPWTTSQGDPANSPYSASTPTYTPGAGPTNMVGGVAYPNLATYPGSGSGAGNQAPYTTGYSGTPGPLAGYCGTGGFGGTGQPAREPTGVSEPMSPYYFPHIEATSTPGVLRGFFDYRPKDTDEALVVATSTDNGKTWNFQNEALELSAGHCPNGNADTVLQTTTDDGEGHAYDLQVGATTWLYTVNRSNGVLDTAGSQFLAHALDGSTTLGLPAQEPVGTGSATTSTGSQTISATPGGVSTSSFTVASTKGFNEVPGRIYVTPAPPAGLPESEWAAALPALAAAILGLGWFGLRRRRATA